MKKFILTLLTAAMLTSTLAGCGATSPKDTPTDEVTTTTEDKTEETKKPAESTGTAEESPVTEGE